MNVITILLSCFLTLPAMPAEHDIQVAFFTIYQEQNHISIDIVLEKEDVLQSLEISETELSSQLFSNYLETRFSVLMNKLTYDLLFNEITVENKHIHITATFPAPKHKIYSIEIFNTCFNELEDHSNIIEIRLNNQERDFLMNASRTNIQVAF